MAPGGGRCCSVPQCNNTVLRDGKSKKLSFHLYPKDETKLQKWMSILGNDKKPSSWARVCSEHFSYDDFTPAKSGKREKLYLKATAIPSQKLPGIKLEAVLKAVHKPTKPTLRSKRVLQIRDHQIDKKPPNDPDDFEMVQIDSINPTNKLDNFNNNFGKDTTLLTELALFVEANCSKTKKDVPVNPTEANFSVHLPDIFLTSDDRVFALTGLPCIALYDDLVTQVAKIEALNSISYRLSSVRDRVLLVFIKLKHNQSYEHLGILFSISPRTVSKVFKSTLKILGVILNACLSWPTLEVIRQNIPKYLEDIENTRVVLHCIEMPIEKPSFVTYTEYNGTQTVKIVIGVTPGGEICYVSKAYGGCSVSDNFITLEGSVLDLCLPMEDGVTVGTTGFLIEDKCEMLGLQLHRDPYFNTDSAKVNVESTVDILLKSFGILCGKFDLNLIEFVHEIITVCAAVVNLSMPVCASKLTTVTT